MTWKANGVVLDLQLSHQKRVSGRILNQRLNLVQALDLVGQSYTDWT